MANFRIFSNNPLVASEYPGVCRMLNSSVMEIFLAVRDSVHLGARLISHPLAGSIKPNESPYKSVVLSLEGGGLDTDSLSLIEGAIAVLHRLGEKVREYPPRVLEDFSVIDLDLVRSAVKALPSEYHF